MLFAQDYRANKQAPQKLGGVKGEKEKKEKEKRKAKDLGFGWREIKVNLHRFVTPGS